MAPAKSFEFSSHQKVCWVRGNILKSLRTAAKAISLKGRIQEVICSTIDEDDKNTKAKSNVQKFEKKK